MIPMSAVKGTGMALDSARLIASLHHRGTTLDLRTIDLCFLAALHARENEDTLTWIDDETMVDLFAQVCELVEPDADNVRTRATHAIQRLRDQRLLARIDGAGLVRAGDFNLTSLATHIIEFFLQDAHDVLTRESLGLLTKELIAKLAEIKRCAEDAGSPEEWRATVVSPLRITIKDLVAGIDRRQRGLDHQQQEVRARISELLQLDWFASVEECEALLEDTAATLGELKTVLLEDAHHMQGFLQDIEQLAVVAHQPDAEDAVRRVVEHIDRLAAWGNSRQQAWSDYYQYVHGFLRDVVRMDRSRALSERLRDQLANWVDDRFFLFVAESHPMRLLRDVEARTERPPVVRPRRDREVPLAQVSGESDPADLEALVLAAMTHSPDTLAGIVREILPELREDRRYLAIGEIAALVARHAEPLGNGKRPWVTVPGRIEIEDWRLRGSDAR